MSVSLSDFELIDDEAGAVNNIKNKIFKNRKALSSKVVPKRLPHREKELREIVTNLSYLEDDDLPDNTLIFGKTGTGKTATVRRAMGYVIPKLDIAESVIIYTIAEDTIMKTLKNIALSVGAKVPERGLSVSDARERIFKEIGDRNAVIIIDEIDRMIKGKYGGNIMYFLTRKENIALIGITNALFMIDDARDGGYIDSRVMSSWNPIKMVFEQYSQEQIKDILNYRIEESLKPGVIDEETVGYISAITFKRGGDVRYAIDLVRVAGGIAVENNASKITIDFVKKAIDKLEDEFLKKSILSLTAPERCLLYIMAKEGECSVSEAYTKAGSILSEVYTTTISWRRWADYRANLELSGYINLVKKGAGRGRGWEHILKINPTLDKELVVKILGEEFKDYLTVT